MSTAFKTLSAALCDLTDDPSADSKQLSSLFSAVKPSPLTYEALRRVIVTHADDRMFHAIRLTVIPLLAPAMVAQPGSGTELLLQSANAKAWHQLLNSDNGLSAPGASKQPSVDVKSSMVQPRGRPAIHMAKITIPSYDGARGKAFAWWSRAKQNAR